MTEKGVDTILSKQRIKKIIIASMIADACGVPVESMKRGTFQVTGMTGGGTYDQPAGSWSDDSSLTLCLMDNLVTGGSLADLFQKMIAYMMNGRYTPSGQLFDIGNATRKAVFNFAKGRPPLKCGDQSIYANGNGALMRIAPLAMTLLDEANSAVRIQTIVQYTQMTHAHNISIVGSILYVELLRALLGGADLRSALEPLYQKVAEMPAYAKDSRQYKHLADPNFDQQPISAVKSTGYVVDSLEAAVWVNEQAKTYQEVVLTAVNLDDDTDTIAQLAAFMFACSHEMIDIPADWQQTLVMTAEARQIMTAFAEKFGE
ncbi:ADP-ribosylglycohydrolase family protein [Lentilactobacillus fungorum]|uniref:ADP-ribosylglycohydrolase family protein n=1 Tax=Lentilactobacillus fungorum TaxID=2201250 RepID=UPI0019431250|nr:ADP-ribosylglycohydrolase family protein [Lentilactobacillus fungorum]